jgi:hypothetical protein
MAWKDEMSKGVYECPILLFGSTNKIGLFVFFNHLTYRIFIFRWEELLLTNHCRTEDTKKELLIQELLAIGVFKKGELHLFELTIRELEEEYAKLTS